MKISSKKCLSAALFFALSSIAFALLNLKVVSFIDMIVGGIAFVCYFVKIGNIMITTATGLQYDDTQIGSGEVAKKDGLP